MTALRKFRSDVHQLKNTQFECPAKWMTVSKLNEWHRRNPRNSYFLPEYKVWEKNKEKDKAKPVITTKIVTQDIARVIGAALD